MTEAQTPKPKKPRKAKPSFVENRIRAGAVIMQTLLDNGVVAWTFMDTGRAARADVCERLLKAGKLIAAADGLFPETSQTFRAA